MVDELGVGSRGTVCRLCVAFKTKNLREKPVTDVLIKIFHQDEALARAESGMS